MKFQRNYRLTVQADDGELIIIESPLTLNFSIERSTMSSVNSAQLTVLNLSKKVRSRIFQDRFSNVDYKRIVLQAGYGKQLSTVFIGNIFQANSFRNGNDIVTFIDARDGGFDTTGTITSKTVEGGTVKETVQSLIGEFANVTEGKIGDIEGDFKKPVVLDGNTFELIKKYTKERAFIDLEELNVLNENEVIVGDVPLLTSANGLLSTPRREDAYLTVETIFEPRIVMGQLLGIKSDIASEFDGQYKVIGVKHQGVISGAVGGECKSTFELLVGSQLFGEFTTV